MSNTNPEAWISNDHGHVHITDGVLLPQMTYKWYLDMEYRTRMKLEQMKGDNRPEAEFYRRALLFALGEG